MRLFFILLALIVAPLEANEQVSPDALFDLSGQLPEIEPEVERRELGLPKLGSLDLEVGLQAGIMSFEDFGAYYAYGADITFHLTEDFFLAGKYGFSKVSDRAFRNLNLPLFGHARTKDVSNKSIVLGWNFLHGEMFWLDSATFSTSAYALSGVGTIQFDSEDYFQFIVGAGMKFVPRDWLSIKTEVQISEYEHSLLGKSKYAHNVETLIGVAISFW